MSKYAPTSKSELFEYAKIQLGQGVNRINVTDDQMETRLRQALDKFNEFHQDATENVYLAYQLTAQDVSRGFVITPEYVISVTHVLSFNGQWQKDGALLWTAAGNLPMSGWIAMGDIAGGFGNTDPGVGPYGRSNEIMIYLMEQQMENYDTILYPEAACRFNPHTHRLYLDTDRSKLVVGQYLVYECYVTLEGLQEDGLWNIDWLKRYFTALVEVQWGINLTKFIGGSLFGGDSQLNGQGILDRGTEAKAQLEQELHSQYTAQPEIWMG